MDMKTILNGISVEFYINIINKYCKNNGAIVVNALEKGTIFQLYHG